MEVTNAQAAEMGAYFRTLCKTGGTPALMAKAQSMVNSLAQDLIRNYPDLAEAHPKAIGRLARKSVMAFIRSCVNTPAIGAPFNSADADIAPVVVTGGPHD
ncbi:MAG: hypothetical protein KMY53_16065 [Desulfarculus sp.]|nr:hypothetical protein [Pseudomonadota bacterium]MBV1715469.1 hypothetical protein [Desulfarculus sp.]MBU4576225.1 hypothetical protein [Pseudomonadota bacterium]MBU4599263.1 hypothetical protein [Pseudomonadota bacterium]MBV1739684.1 hypothetical protein [Desulfarculus sp.]